MTKVSQVTAWGWLHRVLGWDGVLPVCVALLPAGFTHFFPDEPAGLTFLAAAIPIAAFFIRYRIGRGQIASHRTGPALRSCQEVVFVAAILWLCLIDCFVIALNFAPAIPAEEWAAVGVGLVLYFVAMTFAMFPGRADDSAH